MKILFINDQYERGGAGRVAAILANQLYARGYEVVLVHDFKNWKTLYQINEDIPKRLIQTKSSSAGKFSKMIKWLRCVRTLRRYIREEAPDVIVATQAMMFLCTYLANIFTGIPIVVADHTSFSRRINPILDFVRYKLYAKASGLSILTRKDAQILGDRFPNKQVIYNPLSFPVLDVVTQRNKRVLCVGRLEVWKLKGFDTIIRIWDSIASMYPEWVLEIAGSGDEEAVSYLNKMIEERGLSSCVLLGHVNNMQDLYASSEIFALPSRMEGFPMSLMEAMSQGCACVAFEVGGSTREMLEENAGYVVKDGDEEAFEQALRDLMSDDRIRHQFSVNATESVRRFSVDEFLKSWESLLIKTYTKQTRAKQ